MKTFFVGWGIAALLLLSGPAYSIEATGDSTYRTLTDLLAICDSSETFDEGYCRGYIMGINDVLNQGYEPMSPQLLGCFRMGLSADTLLAGVRSFAKATPSTGDPSAAGTVMLSLLRLACK